MDKNINFGWPVTVYLYEDYLRLKECIENFSDVFHKKEMVVFGAGIRGSLFNRLLLNMGFNKFSFVDNNAEKWGGYITHPEHIISPPETLLENKENKAIIVSIENIETVKEQISSYGYIENVDVFYVMTSIYSDYIQEMSRPYNNEFLIMGDCGFSQISIKDTNHKSLGVMLQNELGKDNLKVLGMHGMGMRSFYNIYKQLLTIGQIPKKFLLMTNFEVFTKMHHLLPRTQHAQLFKNIASHLKVNNDEFLEYVEITDTRSSKIYGETVKYDDQSVDDNARLFIKMNYMYRLSEKTEDVIYFIKIMELSKEYNVELIPFIPPVNYEFANQCYDNFMEKYNVNLKQLTSIIVETGFDYLDTSFCIKANQFADIKTIDETCNYEGRLIICDKILNELL